MFFAVVGLGILLVVFAIIYVVLLYPWNVLYAATYAGLDLTAEGAVHIGNYNFMVQSLGAILLVVAALWFIWVIHERSVRY